MAATAIVAVRYLTLVSATCASLLELTLRHNMLIREHRHLRKEQEELHRSNLSKANNEK